MTVGASRSGELPLAPAAPLRSRAVATPPSLPVINLAPASSVIRPGAPVSTAPGCSSATAGSPW